MSEWITDRLPEYNGVFVVTLHIVYLNDKEDMYSKLDLIDIADYEYGIFKPCLKPFDVEYKGFIPQLNEKLTTANYSVYVNISAWQEVKPYERMDKRQAT